MVKKYIVSLTEDEKSFLDGFTSKGSAAASKIKRAQVLQLTDKNRKDGAWKDEDVSQALNVSIATVERTRKCFVEDGMEIAVFGKPSTIPRPTLLDGEKEAHLIALACSSPPEGHGKWSLRLLADKFVELQFVEAISHETVRQTLKKTS